VLMSTIGGMAIFGINGFVLGPVIAALFMTAWSLFADMRQSDTEAVVIAPSIAERVDGDAVALTVPPSEACVPATAQAPSNTSSDMPLVSQPFKLHRVSPVPAA